MMSDERRQEIRDRLSDATPAPWGEKPEWEFPPQMEMTRRVLPSRNIPLILHSPQDIADLLAENDELRAKVEAVKALGERMRWDRSVNGVAHVVRLMLDCIGEDADSLRTQYMAELERGAEKVSGINGETRLRTLAERNKYKAALREVIQALGPLAICDCAPADDCGLRDEAADALRVAREAIAREGADR